MAEAHQRATPTLLSAAVEFDDALHRLASQLLTNYFLAPTSPSATRQGERDRARTIRAAQPLQVNFALLPDDGSEDILALHIPPELVAATAQELPLERALEVAIGIRGKALANALVVHVATLAVNGETLRSDNPLGHEKHITSPTGAHAVLFTPALLARHSSFTPAVVRLMLGLMPAHDGLWNHLRRHISRELATVASGGPEGMKAATECVKELLWTGFLLTTYHKLQPIYVHRAWLAKGFACSLGARDTHTAGPGKKEARALLSIDEFALRYQLFDWSCGFLFAAEKHPLNYNGWHYRRVVLASLFSLCSETTVRRASLQPADKPHRRDASDARCDFQCAYLRKEFEATAAFLRRNNTDSSAASYLLFLITQACELFASKRRRQRATEDTAATSAAAARGEMPSREGGGRPGCGGQHGSRVGGGEGSVSGTAAVAEGGEHEEAMEAEDFVVPGHLWRLAFALTQQQLRVHAEKGHECFFFLRLGLVELALRREATERSYMQGVESGKDMDAYICHSSSWTVRDELEWVSVFVDGFTTAFSTAGGAPASATTSDEAPPQDSKTPAAIPVPPQLLTPTPPVANAWVQCSGSEGFTSYLACRYGIQLLALLASMKAGG